MLERRGLGFNVLVVNKISYVVNFFYNIIDFNLTIIRLLILIYIQTVEKMNYIYIFNFQRVI